MLARSVLPNFDYVRATSADEVVSRLQQDGPDVRLMMGGTDLLVRMRDGLVRPKWVVDVKHLPGMRELRYDGEVGLTVGAAVTMNRVACHPAVWRHYPLLAEAAASVASYQLRNRATLGGNLCNASPAADTAPAVLALEGRLVVYGPKGQREIAAQSFFLGPGKSTLAPEEFLIAVRLPAPPAGSAGRYLKLSRNKVGDLAIAGVTVLGYPDRAVPSGFSFRVALASVAPVPLLVPEAAEILATGAPGEEAFAAAAEQVMLACSPIDDVRATAAYRRAMVRVLTLRALRDVWGRLAPTSTDMTHAPSSGPCVAAP